MSMPGKRQNLRPLICATQWCGLIPMILGSIIFLLWVWSASTLLPLLGLLNMVLGLCLFGTGMGLLYALRLRAGDRWLPGTAMAAVLLLGNFPLALTYGGLGSQIELARQREAACRAMQSNPVFTGAADARRPC
ncbi:hypothetical protein ACUHMQ_00675 [Chitinimonas sp. PSY-7]|uniref:hypothetical protein n=1 Tax=Chitinimonas sp. PSY-7 TaxID=3459088 RepID=UPI00403FCEBA